MRRAGSAIETVVARNRLARVGVFRHGEGEAGWPLEAEAGRCREGGAVQPREGEAVPVGGFRRDGPAHPAAVGVRSCLIRLSRYPISIDSERRDNRLDATGITCPPT